MTDFIAHGPVGSIERAVPHGWTKDGTMEFSGRPITRCASDVCRAWVSDGDRRQQHDREFHLLLIGPVLDDGSHTLTLDGVEVGSATEVRTGWHVRLPARGALFHPVDLVQETLDGAVAEAARVHPLAKWIGYGLHTSSWQPVRP